MSAGIYSEGVSWQRERRSEVEHGQVRADHIEFTPLDLDEGEAYRSEYDDVEFLSRRGLAQVATGPLADSILVRLRDLSSRYGADLTLVNARATLTVAARN